jgi:hypothetical protein
VRDSRNVCSGIAFIWRFNLFERFAMRHLIFAAASAACILASFGTLSPAAAATSRYCLQGRHWGYPGNCQFPSMAACRASASGTNATCGINPRYAFARQRGLRTSRLHPRD